MPTLKSSNKTVGVTIGDPGGIGPEVSVKALSKVAREFSKVQFFILGDAWIIESYRRRFPANCQIKDVTSLKKREWKPGRLTSAQGRASWGYLKEAVRCLADQDIHALVTAPVCKEAIVAHDASFVGHTELLAKSAKRDHVGMMFVAHKMRTIIVTRHVPLRKVPRLITEDLVFQTIMLTDEGLKKQFKIKRPRIAVCGLNPHAGENGLLGREDVEAIQPAIRRARRKHVNVEGPFPADTLFVTDHAKAYDCIVAMYHDQGLIPIKTLYFNELVNMTIGLPYVRTSPAHGTAFDIAGKDKANPSSMMEALRLAAKLV